MKKKLIAPIIITVLLITYLIVYGTVLVVLIPLHWALKLLLALIPIVLIVLSICVLIERIKEIKSGEEDDLDRF